MRAALNRLLNKLTLGKPNKPPESDTNSKPGMRDALKKRSDFQTLAFIHWGKTARTWRPDHEFTDVPERPPEPNSDVYKIPFSDQRAAFATFICNLLNMLNWETLTKRWRERNECRLYLAGRYLREGNTAGQRIVLAFHYFAFELSAPALWLFQLFAVVIGWLLTLVGIGLPLLWLLFLIISRFGLEGKDPLAPGENGYTRVFRGGEVVDLNELEAELMERNVDTSSIHSRKRINTVSISYKHFANKGKVPGDDGRISKTDLRALATLIKAAAPCNLRFWIDTKLPRTTDSSFERWINRGVRPYGRYLTFLCPSATEHAASSFWLANEYHFASAGKGVMYLEGDKVFYEVGDGSQHQLNRRYFQVIIAAERQPIQVRDEDRAKVINWALCCLRAEYFSVGLLTPVIDSLQLSGEYETQLVLKLRIAKIVTKFGPQELPVVPGKSWNKNNPLILGDMSHPGLDFSLWYGFALDDSPEVVYFVHEVFIFDPYRTVICLEVTLNMSHFKPCKIRIVKKVLRELERTVLGRCKFVALPWLCNWE